MPVVFLRPVFGPFDATYLTENDRQPKPRMRPCGTDALDDAPDALDDSVFFPIVWQQPIQDWADTAERISLGNVDWNGTIRAHP